MRQGVVPHQFGLHRGQGLGMVAGEDAQERLVFLFLGTKLFALGAWALGPQICDAVNGRLAVRASQFQVSRPF